MKASELINRLQELLQEHGDLECTVFEHTQEYSIVDPILSSSMYDKGAAGELHFRIE